MQTTLVLSERRHLITVFDGSDLVGHLASDRIGDITEEKRYWFRRSLQILFAGSSIALA
jgi:hypothetical protein